MKHFVIYINLVIATIIISHAYPTKNGTQVPERKIQFIAKLTGSTEANKKNEAIVTYLKECLSSTLISSQDWIRIAKIGTPYIGEIRRAGSYTERTNFIPKDFEKADGSGSNIDCLKAVSTMTDINDAFIVIISDTYWSREGYTKEIQKICDLDLKLFNVVISKSHSTHGYQVDIQQLFCSNGSIVTGSQKPSNLHCEVLTDILHESVKTVVPGLPSSTPKSSNPEGRSTKDPTSAVGISSPNAWLDFGQYIPYIVIALAVLFILRCCWLGCCVIGLAVLLACHHKLPLFLR